MGGVMANDQEEFTLAEFVAGFSLERISLGGPVFDPQKLTWLNGKYLRKMTPPELLGRLREYLLADEYMLRVLPLVQERIDTLEGFFEYGHFFFAGEVAYDADAMKQLVPKGRSAAETAKALQVLLEERIDPLLEWEAGVDRGRAARVRRGRGLAGQGPVHDRARGLDRARGHSPRCSRPWPCWARRSCGGG
jgi:glutamyl-tRNA synthetase